jgi:two-component system response regulator YesN
MEISCKTAKYAYDLYFFLQKELILYDEITEIEEISFEDYDELLEKVYRSIVAKDENVYEDINSVLDSIEKIQFGNRNVVINHCIMFIGELGKKLKEINLKKADFRKEQEAMQERLRHQNDYPSVRKIILDFYKNLIPRIHRNIGQGNISESMEIKKYIEKNYMKDFTLKELADTICVSQGYSSAFFKNAMGKNFRTYLMDVRMKEALKMVLQTDMKTYEIAEAVGYNSVRRFVDAFKNIYKMSPMEYRKEFKKI